MESGNRTSPYGSLAGDSAESLESNMRNDKKSGRQPNYFKAAATTLAVSVLLICTVAFAGVSRSKQAAEANIDSVSTTMQAAKTSEFVVESVVSSASQGQRPNIVFVLVDDLGYNEINALSVATPFMRELASKSVRLTQYYTQETCTPSRAALMTGRYPISTGVQFGSVTSTEEFGLDTDEILLPQVLKKEGNYKNYMIGKWNLGHFSPEYLPTARGFDQFLGFLDGQNSYWSKAYPSQSSYVDFMYADSQCYAMYDGSDRDTYSSALYGRKAMDVINQHDYDANPMFLYFSSQAVHDPFTDDVQFPDGNQQTYLTYSTWADHLTEEQFNSVVASSSLFLRQNYALSLAVLDSALKKLYTALETKGQLSNTYFILASDNGGCFAAGAANGELRGTKGSLFEGGTKVDAFIYNPKLATSKTRTYNGIMHVTDWFPTILGLAGIEYKPPADFLLDGFNQASALAKGEESANPRELLLYNAIINVEGKDLAIGTNAPVAVRNSRYKLIHSFVDNPSATYYTGTIEQGSDVSCPQSQSMTGTYQTMMFDLLKDPNERTDLFGSPAVIKDQKMLTDYVTKLRSKVAKSTYLSPLVSVTATWDAAGSFVQPWKTVGRAVSNRMYPSKCTKTDNVFSPVYK